MADFGQALEDMKQGRCVTRKGWNGKDMFLFQTVPSIDVLPEKAAKAALLLVAPSVCMKTADNKIVVGWLASQTDMLAEDWVTLE